MPVHLLNPDNPLPMEFTFHVTNWPNRKSYKIRLPKMPRIGDVFVIPDPKKATEDLYLHVTGQMRLPNEYVYSSHFIATGYTINAINVTREELKND